MKFLDEAKIHLKAGDGGSGCISFRREKFVEYGGPDGGDGGSGGNILFESEENLNTLIDFRYQQHFKAKNGKNGSGKNRTGQNGKNIIIKVPVGTVIMDSDKNEIYKDLVKKNERFLILKGGKGGIGNLRFKSSTNQAPRKFTKGKEGEELWVWLRLKLIADIGFVGLPNSGKSTLLSVLSNAKAKVANYPFTTLKPQLGLLRFEQGDLTLADLPGLISGASQGVGLGLRFLAHIERCRAYAHLCDLSVENDEQIIENYRIIRNEMENYGKLVSKKKEIIILTKSDLVCKNKIRRRSDILKKYSNSDVTIISSHKKDGISELKSIFREILDEKTTTY
ncbi:MAG: GTPase ObgE [Rickettsiales bacterium]|nr:GTPase ObgE [Rickettsiales bacterium]RPG13354.1 MAG: GTPase ObgE [Pelagibacteraceae bacterium TMED195]|tara:strand:- start:178 stop:1188 length:1011 start_codon:yes stop_codon:yes gene_type:complete